MIEDKEHILRCVLDLVERFAIPCEKVSPSSSTSDTSTSTDTDTDKPHIPTPKSKNIKSNAKEIRTITRSVLLLISNFFDDRSDSGVAQLGGEDDSDADRVGDGNHSVNVDDKNASNGLGSMYIIGGEGDDDIILLDET